MSGKPIDEAVVYEAIRQWMDPGSARIATAQVIAALTAAQQQGQAVEGCPHCGGTGGHWEGCRAPVDIQPMQQGGPAAA